MSWISLSPPRPYASAWPAALRLILRGLALPAALLVVWQLVCVAQLIPAYILPSPATVGARLAVEFARSAFLWDVTSSLARVLKGFIVGSAGGLVFGLLLGLSVWADRLLGPLFLAYRQIALFAWVPLLSMWFGGGEAG